MANVGVDENLNLILLAGQLKDTRKIGVTFAADNCKFNNCLTTPTKSFKNGGQLKNEAYYNTPYKAGDKHNNSNLVDVIEIAAKRLREMIRTARSNSLPMSKKAHKIFEKIGKKRQSPTTLQAPSDFADSPQRLSQEELKYMTKLAREKINFVLFSYLWMQFWKYTNEQILSFFM